MNKKLSDLFENHQKNLGEKRLAGVQACIVTDASFINDNAKFVLDLALGIPASFRLILPAVGFRKIEQIPVFSHEK